jgi:tetratricopeptide (TPR) repeat protein
MSLKSSLRSGVAAVCIASIAAPAGYAAPAAAARPVLDVRVAQATDFSRLEFHWAAPATVTSRREGDRLVLRFSRDANPDIAQLKIAPPPRIKAVEARHADGRLELWLTLSPDADFKLGSADGAAFLNVFDKAAPPPPPPSPPPPPPAPPPPRPNPVPGNGVVALQPQIVGGQLKLRFDWKNPLGAAVFRRGEAIWLVFDASAKLDISRAPKGVGQYTAIQALRGANYSAIRIVTPRTTPVSVVGEGASWTLMLGPGPMGPRGGAITVSRDEESASAALSATMAGGTMPVWVDDPAVGDRIGVVPAMAPAKALGSRREYVDLALLPTIQGLAVEPYASDVAIQVEGDLVRIGRPSGLALSPSSVTGVRMAARDGAPQAAAMPGLIGDGWAHTASGGFIARYDALMNAAAAEAAKGGTNGQGVPTEARMALARFLVGNELSFEAIGVLDAAARSQETLKGQAEWRGLRGIANVMAGRLKEAEADFASPVLADDPASANWRGYIADQLGQYADARQKFDSGVQAAAQFPTIWRARFARANAEAALALGDFPTANAHIADALNERVPALEELKSRLIQAKLMQAMGDKARAQGVFEAISRAGSQQVAAPALLYATQIKLDSGQINATQATATFDAIRYRWRGDATELETIRLLGQLYLQQGRYREALEALRSAGQRLPDLPQSVQLTTDLSAAFRSLFLDGMADGLQPIQALGLFEDFKDLTPIGADGDLMVRKMVRRLIDVDLLDRAAELLQYQVDNRLDGVPKAQVSTDLATVYLMNRQPEKALDAINASRTTLLPPALNAERRIVTARALMSLGRLDAAEEIIENDNTPDALMAKAEIAWKGRTWPAAGQLFEKSLGERWKTADPLTLDEEGRLLRAGVAYSLAGDDASLARLRGQYAGFFDKARNPEALKVAFTDVQTGTYNAYDFSRAVADDETFTGWVVRMKQRFRDRPAPVGPSPSKQAQAASGGTKG